MSLNTLGVAAFLRGANEAAGDYLQQALGAFQGIRNLYGSLHTLSYLTNTLPIGDPHFSPYVAEGLHMAQDMEQDYFALHLFVGAARWYAVHENRSKAHKLIDFVRHHKSFDSNLKTFIDQFEKHLPDEIRDITQPIDDLEGDLGTILANIVRDLTI